MKKVIGALVALFVAIPLVSVFLVATSETITPKLMALVYFVENVTSWEFITLTDILSNLSLILVILAVVLGLCYFLTIERKDENGNTVEHLGDKILKSLKEYGLNPLILLIAIGTFGSVMNAVIPDKNTAYLLAGTYVTGSAIDNCSGENTVCAQMVNKLNTKAMSLLESEGSSVLDSAIESATKTVTEVTAPITEVVEESGKLLDKATESATNAVEKVNEVVEKVDTAKISEKANEALDTTLEVAEKATKVKEAVESTIK